MLKFQWLQWKESVRKRIIIEGRYQRLDQISMSWNRNLGPTKVQLASKGLLFVYKLSFIILYAITPSKLKALIDE
jgi:hypothetical protein